MPLAVGILQIALSIACFKSRETLAEPLPDPKKSYASWFWYSAGYLLWIASYYSFLLSIYSPHIYKATAPVPRVGVSLYLIGSCLAAAAFHAGSYFSRHSAMREMFAWTVYLTTLCCMFITAEFSLVLVYAMPGHNTVYPFLAGLMALAQVPYSILLISLVGLYRKPAANTESPV